MYRESHLAKITLIDKLISRAEQLNRDSVPRLQVPSRLITWVATAWIISYIRVSITVATCLPILPQPQKKSICMDIKSQSHEPIMSEG